jgi:SAM-dependent methyltransferase
MRKNVAARVADWQLPAGVSRGVWEYVHDPAMARDYDAQLADCPLLSIDLRFTERHFDHPGRLIDLGCGTGRLLIPFAKRHYQVLGVDLSEGMLKAARDRASAACVAVALAKANLVELGGVAAGAFDWAACLFSTLGMITGKGNRRQFLGHVRRLLRPGGKFVLHVHNYWFNFRDRQGRRWLARDLIRSAFGGDHGGDRPMPAHHGIGGLALHHFSRREAVGLLRNAGFRVLEVVPVSLREDGRLVRPWWLGRLRTYGYLLAAQRGH